MKSTAWERRLEDLGSILEDCCKTYFDPDLFRRNTNNFLQTARTVTFLIQKDKGIIPDFDSWYTPSVQDAWKIDPIMIWAKDSRNIIEKQGDLELNSSLDVSLVFSYLREEDVHIEIDKDKLLGFGIKRLVRFAQKQLPTGISDVASVRVARKWVTANLSDWELLSALVYVYERHHSAYKSLCQHINHTQVRNIINPNHFESLRANCISPTYVKLRGLDSCRQTNKRVAFDESVKFSDALKNKVAKISSDPEKIDSPQKALDYLLKMSHATFSEWGYHVPIMHLFNNRWELVEILSTEFKDQADKYFFWRSIGEKVENLNIAAIAWICEAWHRSADTFPWTPARNLPIIGESLRVVVIHRDGSYLEDGWEIKRDPAGGTPTLEGPPSMASFDANNIPNYLAPVCRAMGGVIEEKFNDILHRRRT